MFLLASGLKSEAAAVTDWDNKVITVTGMGAMPPQAVNPAQARMLGRRAAIADAYRLLTETVAGVKVDSETTVEMMLTTSDIIRTKVSGIVKGAQIISERAVDGGGYEVTMQVPIFGVTGSIATAVLTPPPAPVSFPQPAPEVIPSMPADSNTGDSVNYSWVQGGDNSPMGAIGGYTGLIIDCRGLNLNPVMSPVIKNSDGVKLYGHENLNYDLVIKDGMVNYASNSGQVARAGSKPLTIKAVRLEDNNANPVVSVADGNRILIENGASGFLNKTAVVFLH